MRGRWLKPEFVKDKKMGQLGLAAALVYQTLWCMADDGGVARGAAEEIKGEMLVWWEELDVPTVRASLIKLEDSGRITGYTIGDHQYWTLHNLLKHQGKIHKPSKFRHPRPTNPRSGAGVVPESAGTTRNLDTSIPQHLDTSTPTGAVVEKSMAGVLITRLNQGMLDNPLIGEAMNPIPHGHGHSVVAADVIEQAGVPQEFAAGFVYNAARSFKPADRNRQIKSLGYLSDATITAWQKSQALKSANGSSRPTVTPRPGNDKAGRSIAALNEWLSEQEAEITDIEVITDGN